MGGVWCSAAAAWQVAAGDEGEEGRGRVEEGGSRTNVPGSGQGQTGFRLVQQHRACCASDALSRAKTLSKRGTEQSKKAQDRATKLKNVTMSQNREKAQICGEERERGSKMRRGVRRSLEALGPGPKGGQGTGKS